MREIIEIPLSELKPEREEVLKAQGVPAGREQPERLRHLLEEAMEIFFQSSHPRALISELTIPQFEALYKGEGLNAPRTPLEGIFRKADGLALFAFTLGRGIGERINALFRTNEFALANFVDSIASTAADKAIDLLAHFYLRLLSKRGEANSFTGILGYSPGYCGWHISGQKRLFEFLHPEVIGIELLDSFLMRPLKSISGVLVAGRKEIHQFADSYPFCNQCPTHSCQERIRKLLS